MTDNIMIEPPAAPVPMSLTGRLMNILVAPSEVFEDLRIWPPAIVNWAVPLCMVIVMGIIMVNVIYSQPGVLAQIREKMEKPLNQQVREGKITQAQADQTMQGLERFAESPLLKAIGSCSIFFISPAVLFWWALLLWLMGKWIQAPQFTYLKALEICGLALVIDALGLLVATLLTAAFGKIGTPSLALFLKDPQSPFAGILTGTTNVFSIWFVAAVSLGLSKFAGTSFVKAAVRVFGVWIGWWCLWCAAGYALTRLVTAIKH